MTAPSSDLRRYATLIESALAASPPAFVPQAESDAAIQVERGIVFPALLTHPPRPAAEQTISRLLNPESRDLNSYAIVDQRGHRRPVYRGLLIYAAFQAVNVAGGARAHWKNGLRPWANLMHAELARQEWPAEPSALIPAASGAAATDAAWTALALHVAAALYGEESWQTGASAVFAQLARRQRPGGPFLAAGPSDNPETHWYHELVLLHAAASYAAQSGDAAVSAAVARNAAFHQAETQPDHATNQPWGLPAFVASPATRPLADQLLHAATAMGGAGGSAASGVTSILLGDALYCLRLLDEVTA